MPLLDSRQRELNTASKQGTRQAKREINSLRPSFFASSKYWFSGAKPHCLDGTNAPDISDIELGVLLGP